LVQRAKHASNASPRPTAVRPPPRGDVSANAGRK
jgi:hypothetical protein